MLEANSITQMKSLQRAITPVDVLHRRAMLAVLAENVTSITILGANTR